MTNVPPVMIPDNVVSCLRNTRHVVAMTGAGVSAESGIPTFRDAQTGLWAQYSPHDLATPQAFRRNPRLVWEWYTWRRELVARAVPNPGHYALVALERHVPKLTLITQNVDGLHSMAGNRKVIELHGNITRTRCADEARIVDAWYDTGEVPPHCPYCGGLMRPDVVWFGEMLPEHAIEAAIAASNACDLFLAIGTSGVVEPAASLPFLALRQGAHLVVVNPEQTIPVSQHVTHLPGPAGVLLPALVRAAWPDVVC